MLSQRLRGAFAFGHFVFDPHAQSLQRDGRAVELGSRALDVLTVLVEANGDLVAKNTLMDQVWPGIAVEENNLQVQVSALRRVLGDERDFIRTVPGRGYQFAGEIVSTQAPVAEASVKPDEPEAIAYRQRLSIVVLPFVNLSDDATLDYFVDGVTDSLITDLSRALPGSFVISRSTAFSFKGRAIETRLVGEQLGVRYVLEGSIMPAGEMIRINAQLIDTVTDMHLWAERFDKPRADVLTVQDEIVGRLTRSVGLHMARSAAMRSATPHEADAMDLVMRGFAVVHQRMTLPTSGEALQLFRTAIKLDARHVEAHVGLASMLVYQVVNFYRQDRDVALDEAATSIDLAMSIDPTHLEGLKTWGAFLRARGLFQDAIEVDRVIIQQNPGEPTAYREVGLNKLYLGHFEEAIIWFKEAERVAPLDPSRWTWLQGLGRSLIAQGRDEEAVAALRLAVESRPGVPEIYGLLAAAEALAGLLEPAHVRFLDYAGREPNMTLRRWASRSHVPRDSLSPAYRAANDRMLKGLCLAGMPDGGTLDCREESAPHRYTIEGGQD